MQAGKFQQAFEHLGTALTFDPQNTRAILAAGSMMQVRKGRPKFLNFKINFAKVQRIFLLWDSLVEQARAVIFNSNSFNDLFLSQNRRDSEYFIYKVAQSNAFLPLPFAYHST